LTPQPSVLVGHGPKGVLHVASDGEWLVAHTGIVIGAPNCADFACSVMSSAWTARCRRVWLSDRSNTT
jgi:hypothetical protein